MDKPATPLPFNMELAQMLLASPHHRLPRWMQRRAVDTIAHLTAINAELVEALEAAEESIVCFMGQHNYPHESGAGMVLDQVRATIAHAKENSNG